MLVTGLLMINNALAHDHTDNVVPDHQRKSAEADGFEGPRETTEVEALIPLGSVPLKDEFEGMDNRLLRAQELVQCIGMVPALVPPIFSKASLPSIVTMRVAR